jgi:beta-phosphoglucomutase-like phosphatase (HAD superfamily)
VEDSPAGTKSALAAGMPVVVVTDLIAPPDDVVPHVAGVFESLDALREAVTQHWMSSHGAASTGALG